MIFSFSFLCSSYQVKDMTTTLKKVIRPGTIMIGNRRVSIYIEIELTDGKLSIHGVEGPRSNGDCFGSCGQIDMGYDHRNPEDNDRRTDDPIKPEGIDFAPGWDKELWLDLLEAWARWHNNELHPGCEHQRALGWEREGYDKHPSEPCPTCGYKFGSAWNRVEVPEDVITLLKSLPLANQKPAWV